MFLLFRMPAALGLGRAGLFCLKKMAAENARRGQKRPRGVFKI
jgi:hypothetical protein